MTTNNIESVHQYLQEASIAQVERMLSELEEIPLAPRVEERIRIRIRQKLAANRIHTRGLEASKRNVANERKPQKKQTRFFRDRHAAVWLSIAASLILVIGILSVPSVSRALYSLLHPDFDKASYMLDRPEQRTPIPELEEALAAASPSGDSYYIELLGEYSGPLTRYDEDYNKDIPKLRADMGFRPFDKEEFSFLRELRPEVREVLYDGTSLTVNTYFESDHAADFLSMWYGVDVKTEYNLDMTCFDYMISVDDKDVTNAYSCGYGSGTMMSLSGMSNEDIQNSDGFWHTLEIEPLPQKLPDGEIEMTILYYIYDGDIDDMGAVGNIGRVVHTFTFDATEGNHAPTDTAETTLSNSAVLTIMDWQNNTIENRTVSLDGIKLHAEASYGQSGILVKISGEYSGEWTENMFYDFMTPGGKGRNSGLCFDLYVDGEFIKTLSCSDSKIGEINLELPIFPSEYEEISEILLRPTLTYLTHVSRGEGTEKIALPVDTEPMQIMDTMLIFEDAVAQELTGCDILIPLPKD